MSWEHWHKYYYFIRPICGENVNILEDEKENNFSIEK